MTLTGLDRSAHRTTPAARRFLIPSIAWYGLAPDQPRVTAAAGAPALEPGGWGGRIGTDEAVHSALKTVDPIILLLNLAGYQVTEAAIGIPASAAETAAPDLVAADLRAMTYAQGTRRPWTALGDASAQVALWTEPRFPIALPGDESPTMSMEDVAAGAEVWTVRLDFAASGTGWLRLFWPAAVGDGWGAALGELVPRVTDPLVAVLGAAPSGGLLGLYEVANWRTPRTWDPAEAVAPPIAEFGENLGALLAATGRAAFLTDEIADRPPSVQDRWLSPPWVDLSYVGSELQRQTDEESLTDQQRLALSDLTVPGFPQPSVTQLLLYAQELGVLDFLTAITEQVETAYGGDLYGGKALARGDQGEDVAQLRRDLNTLGFGPMFAYDPSETGPKTFDWDLELAVRELQGYAKMPSLAQEQSAFPGEFYGDRLLQVTNPAPYAGPVSGVVNAATRAVILRWLGAQLRCPVVVEARRTAGGGKYTLGDTVTDNLWRSDQLERGDSVVQMYARDFTGHWTLLPESREQHRSLQSVLIGKWQAGGPVALAPTYAWEPEDELTTDSLAGGAIGALTAGERSTFRAIRATAEIEVHGFFEEINAWDNAFISLGPFQWTFALADGRKDLTVSELPAYFAYLDSLGGEERAAYEAAFAMFGCGVATPWAAIKTTQGKYTSWITLQNEAGGYDEAPKAFPHVVGEWFRDWHWFMRLSMAVRTIEPFRRRMWDYARMRLRNILAIETSVGAKKYPLGALFTSEKAVALLLRWHVKRPGGLMRHLDEALAGAAGWGAPGTWGDDRQATLCAQLLTASANDQAEPLGTTMKTVAGWGDPASADWHDELFWALDYDALVNRPGRTAPLATPRDKPVEVPIDWRDPIGAVKVLSSPGSSDQAVVAASGLVLSKQKDTLTITPVPGASGTTTITVTADNGAHVATSAFFLVVGGGTPPKDPPPQPAGGTTGLSTRRNSFLPAFGGLK